MNSLQRFLSRSVSYLFILVMLQTLDGSSEWGFCNQKMKNFNQQNYRQSKVFILHNKFVDLYLELSVLRMYILFFYDSPLKSDIFV
jgi:hypothetical protein